MMAQISDTVTSKHQVFKCIIAEAATCGQTKSPKYAKCLQKFSKEHCMKLADKLDVFFKVQANEEFKKGTF